MEYKGEIFSNKLLSWKKFSNIAIYILFSYQYNFLKFQYNGHLGGKVSTLAGYDHFVKLSGGLFLLAKLSNTLLLCVVTLRLVKTS
jgi:hypothetical protein